MISDQLPLLSDPTRNCEKCGTPFVLPKTGNRFKKRFCSKGCARRNWRIQNPEKWAKLVAEFKERRPRYSREAKIRKKYGLTIDQEDGMLKSQGGKCAGCHKKFTEKELPHVDHCHNTNVVRGLLCKACNWFAGRINDDWVRCAKLADYLRRNELFANSKKRERSS